METIKSDVDLYIDLSQERCLICSCTDRVYLFGDHKSAIVKCSGCSLMNRRPLQSTEITAKDDKQLLDQSLCCEEDYISCMKSRGFTKGKVLVLGHKQNSLSTNLFQHGYETIQIPEINELSLSGGQFDCIILDTPIEKYLNPMHLFEDVNKILKTDGLLVLKTVLLDNATLKDFALPKVFLLRALLKKQDNYFFSLATLQLILEKNSFANIAIWQRKRLNYSNRKRTSENAPQTSMTARNKLPLSIISARKSNHSQTNKLSIIMPVFNECSTIEHALTSLLNTKITGVTEREIVIVESNSSDGTREIVERYSSYPGIKIIFEDRPNGKGHAVRTAFKHITGSVVIIQDGDLEYDMRDYSALLKPLLSYEKVFVLGTRHAGNWKIRKFESQVPLAFLCNLGHIFFATLINVLYGQRMTDPFTMFKVFRRECLYGLKFDCNRFDFDHELLIKLIRKGYEPFEIPVNYKARSFIQGKKIQFFKDPWTWLKADFKYRFADIYDKEFL